MKKLITLSLIIIFLISLGFEVFAASCSGTCTACSSFSGTNSGTCTDQLPCAWTQQGKICSGSCIACSTYSDQSSCNDQGGCTWTAVCGDGTCDSSEDCSSCNADCACGSGERCESGVCNTWCGNSVCDSNEDCSCSDCDGKQADCQANYFCSGGGCTYSGSGGTCANAGGACKSDPCRVYLSCGIETGGSCDTGYCCTGSCTTEFSACGNDECESGETCLNCESDCGTCIENSITMAFREPLNRDTLNRGTHTLKTIVYLGRRPTSSAKVFAESELFPAKLRLYDDGSHKDEKQFDGIYGREFTLGKDVKPGEYKIKLTAEKEISRAEETIRVTIDPELRIKLSSFKKNYVKGERINLDGLVEDFKESRQNVTIKLSLDRLGDILYSQTYKTNVFGKFLDSYLISFADPDGEWNLKINAEDAEGNKGNLELKPRIGTPEGVTYYLVEFLSPIKGSTYSRGETVPITVEVSKEEQPIKEAELSFISPKGEYLKLTEIEPGTYTTNYQVLFDDPLGPWRLAVQAIKTVDNITKAGGNTIPLQINSGEIRFQILSPIEEKIFTGMELNYEIKLTYPNDELIKGADLKAKLSNNKTLNFLEEKPGIYTANYLVESKDIGTLDSKMLVDDNKGNTAELPSLLLYVKERTIVEFYLVTAYQKLIRPYWWAILSLFLISGIIYKPFYEVKRLKSKIKKAKYEQETIRHMHLESERDYYKHKTLNKTDFRKLIQQYKERLAKAKEHQKIAEKKLEKRLKKKH